MCAKEFVDAVKHHMLHLLQRRKTPDAERYVCLRLVYETIILSTIVDLSLLNSILRALWKTDNFQGMTQHTISLSSNNCCHGG